MKLGLQVPVITSLQGQEQLGELFSLIAQRAERAGLGCVAKIFKLIKIDCVIAAKTTFFRENEYTFYLFYPCSIVEYLPS